MSLLKLRGRLSKSQSLLLGIIGFILFILLWWALAEVFSIQRPVIEGFETRLPSSVNPDGGPTIDLDSLARADSLLFANATEFEKVYPLLPTPLKTVQSYPTLIQKEQLLSHTLRSIWLNLQGYFWAILISVVVGFTIGLIPLIRGLFSKQVDAMRYLPLTAFTGLFIIWFGIDDPMKIAFLAFGIIVFMLPVVVQRIDEVEDVYLKTVFTLGATDWQTIRSVYIPAVMSKLIDDIRVLTAISWTYIIIVEYINKQGGIGALIYFKQRQGQIEKMFAILIIIILIGFIQDRLFVFIDKRLFPHKYYKTSLGGMTESQYGILTILGSVMLFLMIKMWVPGISTIMATIIPLIIVASILIIAYGEFKLFKSAKQNG